MEDTKLQARFRQPDDMPLNFDKAVDLDGWLHKYFSSRQAAEIRLAREYMQNYGHGTAGHMSYIIIAKLAALLSAADLFGIAPANYPTTSVADLPNAKKAGNATDQ